MRWTPLTLATVVLATGFAAAAPAALREPTNQSDVLFGDAAPNTFHAKAGNDLVDGLGANDTLFGDSGDDYIDGDYKERNPVFGVWGDDALYGGKGSDWLQGNEGNDTLYGGIGRDELDGGPDDDHLDGGAGRDLLFGDAGNDAINARDGVVDKVHCGGGIDTATADPKDRVDPDCETVTR